jgi:GntR family transcriptional repressor for pyruvate dehydrogenase complex
MQPIKKVRLSDSVIDAIEAMIDAEQLKPGDKIFSEHELTRRLQVSRASVREAIRILEVTGRVTVKHGKGVYLADYSASRFEPFVAWLQNNEQSLNDSFELRLIIEPDIAALAAQRAEETDIDELNTAHKYFTTCAADANTTEIIKSDRNFHRLLAGASKNRALSMLMHSITTSLPGDWISSLHTPGRIKKTITEHGEVLKAVTHSDSNQARHCMHSHLTNAWADIRNFMHQHTTTVEERTL